jgi:hypothetical protein
MRVDPQIGQRPVNAVRQATRTRWDRLKPLPTAIRLISPQQIEAAYIDGRKIDLSNRQTRLRDKYKEKYRRK